MGRTCTNHCRGCDAHFTSLRAFDAHRCGLHGNGARRCRLGDDLPLVRLAGSCSIADPDRPEIGVTLYEHADAQRVREYHRAENGPQAVSTHGKSGF